MPRRAGTKTPFWWGREGRHGSRAVRHLRQPDHSSRSPSPARIVPTASGLYDTAGNAAEWVEDCWNDNYRNAPKDGVAWTSGDCRLRCCAAATFLSKAN